MGIIANGSYSPYDKKNMLDTNGLSGEDWHEERHPGLPKPVSSFHLSQFKLGLAHQIFLHLDVDLAKFYSKWPC